MHWVLEVRPLLMPETVDQVPHGTLGDVTRNFLPMEITGLRGLPQALSPLRNDQR
jgi:hypothetical protein